MFSFRTTDIFKQEDLVLHKGKVMVICNQSAWNPLEKSYTFQGFMQRGNLSCVMVPPEDGLVEHPISNIVPFNTISNSGLSLVFSEDDFISSDAIVLELQDAGCRYFYAPNLIMSLFSFLIAKDANIPVYIIDRPNPSGRQVEGTSLRAGYRSDIGIEGIPHKYGMTIGELATYLHGRLGARFPLHIISCRASTIGKLLMSWTIPLSKDFAGFFTHAFYCGQYLWKGTNISCGEGTLRQYEMFGAPFLEYLDLEDTPIAADSGVYTRWTSFTPDSGLYKGDRCYGYQLMLTPQSQYNSLAHALRLIRCLKDASPSFRILEKEPQQENSLMEMLLGDKELIDFVLGKSSWNETKEHIKVEEQKWIKKTKKSLLYEDEPLFRIK